MAKNRQCGPEANWFCCPDNMYCAATAADCPFVAKKAQLMRMAKNKQCGPDETSCPAGCCPEANWFCCPDNMYCAATAADCPFVAKKAQLMKMAKNRQCGADETECPAGCCPEANWFCCPDNMYCAATPPTPPSTDTNANPSKWHPLILIIPLRLGLMEINSDYNSSLKAMFTLKQSLGVIGGKPNHAHYFFGFNGDRLLYLDPQ